MVVVEYNGISGGRSFKIDRCVISLLGYKCHRASRFSKGNHENDFPLYARNSLGAFRKTTLRSLKNLLPLHDTCMFPGCGKPTKSNSSRKHQSIILQAWMKHGCWLQRNHKKKNKLCKFALYPDQKFSSISRDLAERVTSMLTFQVAQISLFWMTKSSFLAQWFPSSMLICCFVFMSNFRRLLSMGCYELCTWALLTSVKHWQLWVGLG